MKSAQIAMVMIPDKYRHTCSVTCKQVWTNREGTEYIRSTTSKNSVPAWATPAAGRTQKKRKGGWKRTRHGSPVPVRWTRRLAPAKIFWLTQPTMKDYYEPWTYEYDKAAQAPANPARSRRPARSPQSRASTSTLLRVGAQLGR